MACPLYPTARSLDHSIAPAFFPLIFRISLYCSVLLSSAIPSLGELSVSPAVPGVLPELQAQPGVCSPARAPVQPAQGLGTQMKSCPGENVVLARHQQLCFCVCAARSHGEDQELPGP